MFHCVVLSWCHGGHIERLCFYGGPGRVIDSSSEAIPLWDLNGDSVHHVR